jgi:DNA-binding NtrC family response regulator
MKLNVLVVEDNPNAGEAMVELLEEFECQGLLASSSEEGLRILELNDIDTILADVNLPGEDGLWLLDEVQKSHPDIPVYMITGDASINTAVEAIKKGAHDYLSKPVDLQRLEVVLTSARRLRQAALERELSESQGGFGEMVGASPAMQEMQEMILRVAPTPASVLILGESGTGKELVANALVSHSDRSRKPYIKMNSAALPKDTLESELFGHVKGAFTGAIKDRKGRFELANGGTLFLDEIGDMPMETQVKLLRVIQEGEFERVGGSEIIKVDVRIIAATNRNLPQAVKEGEFREDLYYRLNVIQIHVPPLRERREDIAQLAEMFLQRYGSKGKKLEAKALEALTAYEWPGNIRELKNIMERLGIIVARDTIGVSDLPSEVQFPEATVSNDMKVLGTMDEIERQAIFSALRQSRGVKSEAAKALGIGLKTLYRKLDKYQEEGHDLDFLKSS